MLVLKTTSPSAVPGAPKWRPVKTVPSSRASLATAAGAAVAALSDWGMGGDGGGGTFSGKDAEARDAAMAEIAKHCTKGPDGWTTAKATGTSFAAVHYLRQYRELTVEGVNSNDLSDSDRLNGFEWAGEVN